MSAVATSETALAVRYELERDSLTDAEKHEKPWARKAFRLRRKKIFFFRRGPSSEKHGLLRSMASLDTLSSWRATKTIQDVAPVDMVKDDIETRQIVAGLAL